jgi:hypothetical protein
LKTPILVLVALFLIVSVPFVGAQSQREVFWPVWVLGDLGVSLIVEPDPIKLELGKKGGAWVTIINSGSIEDVIRLEAKLNCDNDWIKYRFQCVGTIGECNDLYADPITVLDNIRLDPSISSTKVFLEMTGYKTGSTCGPSGPPLNVSFIGYSLTNYTVQELKEVMVSVQNPDASFLSPRTIPDLDIVWMPLFFFFAAIVHFFRRREIE